MNEYEYKQDRMKLNAAGSLFLALTLTLSIVSFPGAQVNKTSGAAAKERIEGGSKGYVAPMKGGFDTRQTRTAQPRKSEILPMLQG